MIPGHYPSLRATFGMMQMYFRYTTQQILDKRKNKKTKPVDLEEYASLSMLHLDSKVHRYDGFTPGQRVFGRAPKMPIGTVGNPNFSDFTNRNDCPST